MRDKRIRRDEVKREMREKEIRTREKSFVIFFFFPFNVFNYDANIPLFLFFRISKSWRGSYLLETMKFDKKILHIDIDDFFSIIMC